MATNEQDKPAGGIVGALTRLFMKSVTVSEVRALGDHFRLVTLSGTALQGVRWTPGQKVQVSMGGFTSRTYTPLSLNATEGSLQLLVFLHGSAPGAAWGRALKQGDACTLLGPRDSLNLTDLARPGLLFGDETSFGLAQSLRFTPGAVSGVHLLFEVNSKQVAQAVLDQLDINGAELIERQADDAHLSQLEQVAAERVQAQSIQSFVLSGKATSIQRLNKRLKSLGFSSRQIRTRAYWSPGKVGLD